MNNPQKVNFFISVKFYRCLKYEKINVAGSEKGFLRDESMKLIFFFFFFFFFFVVLEWAHRHGVKRLVSASSAAIYGRRSS